mgnify:CR=1 FL=1
MKPLCTNYKQATGESPVIRKFLNKLFIDRFRYRRQVAWQALKDAFFELVLTSCLPNKIQKQNRLLLIRLDAIGDYILFRNFIETLKKSAKYANYSVTLCGNILWRDLAEALDTNFIDRFIWIERSRFRTSLFYRFAILREIRRSGFSVALHSVFSRDFYWGDQIIRHSEAEVRIGFDGDCANMQARQKIKSAAYYTDLIRDTVPHRFEFDRNRFFFETCSQSIADVKKPNVTVEKKAEFKNSIVIFPGASQAWKQWPIAAYAEICNLLLKKTKSELLICGAASDIELAKHIVGVSTEPPRIKNLAGKTSLLELAQILSSCKLLVSNDTSAVHIAAAVSAKAIVAISAGNHYGRFLPYPRFAGLRMVCVFPDSIEKMPEKQRIGLYHENSLGTTITTIEVKSVLNAIRRCGIK